MQPKKPFLCPKILRPGKHFPFKVKGNWSIYFNIGTIASKINVTPKCVCFTISKVHSILAVANLLAHNNISQIYYCCQISLQSAAVDCSISDTFRGNIYFAGDGKCS